MSSCSESFLSVILEAGLAFWWITGECGRRERSRIVR